MLGKYKHWVLNDFPSDNFPQDLSCYRWEQTQSRPIKDGEIRVKVQFVTVDPVSRVWISGARSYLPALKPGDVIPSFGLGKVSESKSKRFNQGDYAVGVVSWAQEWVGPATDVQLIPFESQKMYQFLSIYGPTGLTAYISYLQEMKHLPKDSNIVISSAAGAVGVSLFQFLHALGYTNLYGIAGSDQKCKYVESLGANACINYKTQDVTAQLIKKVKGGVDFFYDNVGQQILDAVLPAMKDHSKVVLCGATATYTKWKDKLGIKNYVLAIMKRIQFKGILYFGSDGKYASAFLQIGQLGLEGCQTVINGLQKAPQTLRDNFMGKYIGKPILRVYEQKVSQQQA